MFVPCKDIITYAVSLYIMMFVDFVTNADLSAQGGTRTHNVSDVADFEAAVFRHFTTRALHSARPLGLEPRTSSLTG